MSQPRGDRCADVGGQRQAVSALALPADDELTGVPVDVVELEFDDLAGAQPESGEQRDDGKVTPSENMTPVAALE